MKTLVMLAAFAAATSLTALGAVPKPLAPSSEENIPAAMSISEQQNAYVIGRYFCIGESDGESRGTCDVETRAATCTEARNAHQQDIASRGDVCKRCTAGMVDNTRKFSGKMQWIHGGPCQ